MPYFSKFNVLTKSDIAKQFIGDNELQEYIPDNCNPSTVTRSFLLSLLFNVKRNKYLNLYDKYKKIKVEQSTTGNEINANSEFANELNNYISAYK